MTALITLAPRVGLLLALLAVALLMRRAVGRRRLERIIFDRTHPRASGSTCSCWW